MRASGLSGAEFARKHGLEVESVYRWSREFADERPQADRPKFEEVRLRTQEAQLSKGEVELCLGKCSGSRFAVEFVSGYFRDLRGGAREVWS